jgi:hypothetical protein
MHALLYKSFINLTSLLYLYNNRHNVHVQANNLIILRTFFFLIKKDDSSLTPGTSHPMGERGNVLNRVGHQQDKWKRQVREQRRNIYDRHTMLN